MEPRFEVLKEKKLVGLRKPMSLAANKTFELWQQFMPRRKEINHSIGGAFYSVEVYDNTGYFEHLNPHATFDKWAAVEVLDFVSVPPGLETIVIPAGRYAVFIHHGAASQAAKTYQHIFGTWLPATDVSLDNRPHFALMGEHYRADDPNAREEIWIPVTQ